MELSAYLEYIEAPVAYLTSNIIFFLLAGVILVCGLLSVMTTKILRAATYLFFVLFATAGLYLLLKYEFLAVVQLSVYAGGILVLFVFAILLIQRIGEETEKISFGKKRLSAIAAGSGAILCLVLIYSSGFIYDLKKADTIAETIDMQQIGITLMGTGKYQYLLAFEAAALLLLACIIGAIVIARKHKEDKK